MTKGWRPGQVMDRLRSRYHSSPRIARWGITLAFVVVMFALPFLMPSLTGRSNYYVAILFKVGLAALLAVGLNVVVGFAGLLDLGYVAFFAIGAYTYAIMTGAVNFTLAQRERLPNAVDLLPRFHLYYWLIFLVAIAICLAAGVLLGAPTLRLRGDYLAIVTLGFGEIVRIVANNLRDITGGPLGVKSIPHPAINIGSLEYDFGINNNPYYWLTLVLVAIAVVIVTRLNASRIGRAWSAIREDEVAAAAMGVATVRMKLLAFATGAAIAATAGVIYASQIIFVSPRTFALLDPTFGSIIVLAMVVLGGMGGIWGPIVGAAAMVFLPEYFRFLGDGRFVVFGAALVLIMIFRPAGLIPSRRRAAELTGGDIREATLFDVQQEEVPS
ncbi:MAG TPA: branched-chain amino acid ABC transporter permease [Actinomycetota bacterium]|nr:branched-chain amino acid ABC transporter permease [Actinomycetota bacterium]